jgi:hypothetical protein
MIREDLAGDGRFETASGFGNGTTWMEWASFRRMNGGRDIACEDDAAPAGVWFE